MWLRLEPQEGTFGGKRQYDGACEELDDLTAEASAGYASINGSRIVLAPGSMVICAEDEKKHLKKADGSWTGTGSGTG